MSSLSSWLAQGKSWADVPPAIKRHAKIEFKIPSAVHGKLLPEPTTSLATMSNYTLPIQITSGRRGPTAELASFFSKDQPCSITSSTILRLHRLHIPETSTIRKLVEFSRQAWLDGYKSIRYTHLHDGVVTNFPLWIVTYWNGVLDVRDHVKRWAACKDWVVVQTRQIKSATRRNLAEEAALLLNDLPWDAKKPSGLSDGELTNTLWRFLQTNWLSDSEMNDMLELLRAKVLSNREWSGKFRVEGVHLTKMILKAFKTAGTDAYMSRREFAWARFVGKELEARKMVLLTAGHLGQLEDEPELHWVAIVVDAEQGVTRYGDSFRNPIPEEIGAAYEWWMNQHRPERLTSNHLPISHQLDGHACGFFAINVLEHHVDPEGCPLLKNDDVGAERLSKFNSVAKHISARLPVEGNGRAIFDLSNEELTPSSERASPPPSSFQSLAADAPFTFTATPDPVVSNLKRPKDHVNAPTPVPSPTKKRVRTGSERPIIPPLRFSEPPSPRGNDSSLGDNDPVLAHGLDGHDSDIPPLRSYESDSDDDDVDEGDDDEPCSPKQTLFIPSLHTSKPMKQMKLGLFWKAETKDEREERQQRDAEKFCLAAEARQKAVEEERQRKVREKRLKQNARQQKHRDREREERIANGWVPGQRKRKRATLELEDFDANDDRSSAQINAESSRPRRQFKEDQRKKNKPQGRKRTHESSSALLTNWFQPFIFGQIEMAARNAISGGVWSPRLIVQEAKKVNPQLFSRLTEQVVGRWIDRDARDAGLNKWKDSVLGRVKRGNAPGGENTRFGVLDTYPDLKNKINTELKILREAGVTLTLLTIRGLMVALINKHAPELFSTVRADGSQFKCSDSFVRSYLRKMGWSERRATKAAQKLPENHEEILTKAFLREAYIIRDHAIPAALRVNTDQTQLIYQQGTKTTWNEKGAKQVATVGQEEKRAFTLVPSIAADGTLLPMQAIYSGQSSRSLPNPSSPGYNEAIDFGFRMRPSLTSTYWSTHETMHDLVDNIIAPYFNRTKEELGLPPSQCSIWKIDCWSVHKSDEFLTWMKKKHDSIIIIFVPGGCTGVWQPLDVGIQRLLKLSLKRSAHRDVVKEVSDQISAGEDIKLDTTIGTLRNRSVRWIANAMEDINDKDLIKKAFELCRVGPFNLSHESLTSPGALAALRTLPKNYPDLYEQLVSNSEADAPVADGLDEPAFPDGPVNEASDIPLEVVREFVTSGGTEVAEGFQMDDEGNFARLGSGEDLLATIEGEDGVSVNITEPILGRGHRTKRARKVYTGEGKWEDWEDY